MFNAQRPDSSELPSTGKLLRSTGIAAVVASALLATVVLPAEYGVDPTGVGSILGLTEMGRIKMQLAAEAEADAAADAAVPGAPAPASSPPVEAEPATPAASAEPVEAASAWTGTFTINLAPDAGYEVKLVMEEGATARFEWFTDGPGVNFDTHGDGAGISYHGYDKGRNVERQDGELTAAFKGSHGWFWRNRSGAPVVITLRTAGDYSDVKQYD
jgi:hypothetical protein